MNLEEMIKSQEKTQVPPKTPMPRLRTFVVRRHDPKAVGPVDGKNPIEEITIVAHSCQASDAETQMVQFTDAENEPSMGGLVSRTHRIIYNVIDVEEVMRPSSFLAN